MKGFNDDELFEFIEFTKDKKVYLRFIEYMPFDDNSMIIKINNNKYYLIFFRMD